MAAPVLDLDASSAGSDFTSAYTENGTGVAIAGAVSLTDVDNANMDSAIVVITNGQAGDMLGVSGVLPGGITASYNIAAFTLMLFGSATKADYQAALQQVRYSSTSDNPDTTARAVNVVVNDGAASSNTAVATVSVTAVNDAPVNTAPAAGWTVVEDGVVRLAGLSIADLDAGTGTMTVTLAVGAGTLTATAGGGVTVAGSGTGTLTLSGSLASLNAYLASASAPTFTPVQDSNGIVTLTMTTNDNGNTGTGGALTDTDTSTISITAINDPPVLDLDASSAGFDFASAYTENGAGAAIAGAVSLTDVDNANMASATVVITNGQAGDQLGVSGALPGGITSSYNGATFTLTLSGAATKADYQAALQQVRYSSTSGNPDTTARAVNVTVNDGAASSNMAVATVSVTAVNDAPVNMAPAAGWTVVEDGVVRLAGLSIADLDAGTGTMTVTLAVGAGTLTATAGGGVTVAGSGTGSLTLSGSLASLNAYLASASAPTFTPVQDSNGIVTLTMTTNDDGNTGTGGALTDTDTSTISITAINDPPVLDLDASSAGFDFASAYTENGAGAAIAGAVSLTDVDNANMASATVVITNGQAGDQLGVSGALPGGITSSYNGATFTLTLSGAATKADYQAALQQVRYSSTSGNPDTTARAINVTVNDGAALSNTAVATVSVTAVSDAPVNTAPVAGWTAAEDTVVVLTGLSIAAPNSGSSTMSVELTVTSGTLTAASGGGVSVTGSGTGTLTLSGSLASLNAYLAGASAPAFTPVQDFNGIVTLTMLTSDGALTDSDTRPITVTPVTDAVADTVTTSPNTAVTINVLANDTFENAARVINAINGTPIVTNDEVSVGGGMVRLNPDDTLTFTPAAGFSGSANFTYTVASGGVSEIAAVTVTVGGGSGPPVNAAPVNTMPGAQTTAEDTALLIAGVSVADAGGGSLTSTLSVSNGMVSVADGGGAVISNNGSGTVTVAGTAAQINTALAGLTFMPASDYNGGAALTLTTSDGSLSDSDTIAITVTPVNDAPVAGADSFTIRAGASPVEVDLLANDTDVDSATLSISAIAGIAVAIGQSVAVTGGIATLVAPGRIQFTPLADFIGSLSFTYTVADGDGGTAIGSVTGTVAPANGSPTAVDDHFVLDRHDLFTVINVRANDSGADGGAVRLSRINGQDISAGMSVDVQGGTVILEEGGDLVFVRSLVFGGTTSFTYGLTDESGHTSDATVTGVIDTAPQWLAFGERIADLLGSRGAVGAAALNELIATTATISPGAFISIDPAVAGTVLGYRPGVAGHLLSEDIVIDSALAGRTLGALAFSGASAPALLSEDGAGGWVSGGDQNVLVQSVSNKGQHVVLSVGDNRFEMTSSAPGWSKTLALQSLRPDFSSDLIHAYDQRSQGGLAQVNLSSGTNFSAAIDGQAAAPADIAWSNEAGLAVFDAGGDGAVEIARPVIVAATPQGAADGTVLVRMRQSGMSDLSVLFFQVDDYQGTINGLKPGDVGYAEATIARAYQSSEGGAWLRGGGFGAYSEGAVTGVDSGDLIAMRLFNGSETFFSFSEVNEKVGGTSVAHLWNYGYNIYGWEDTLGGGDQDYNDLVVQLDFLTPAHHLI